MPEADECEAAFLGFISSLEADSESTASSQVVSPARSLRLDRRFHHTLNVHVAMLSSLFASPCCNWHGAQHVMMTFE